MLFLLKRRIVLILFLFRIDNSFLFRFKRVQIYSQANLFNIIIKQVVIIVDQISSTKLPTVIKFQFRCDHTLPMWRYNKEECTKHMWGYMIRVADIRIVDEEHEDWILVFAIIFVKSWPHRFGASKWSKLLHQVLFLNMSMSILGSKHWCFSTPPGWGLLL